MEELSACPICNSLNFNDLIECDDHTVSHETFKIVECESCGFAFTNPRPGENEIGPYYQSEDYISHSNASNGLVNTLYQMVRKHALKSKYKLIFSITGKPASLLDYGSGTGEFLHTMQNGGFDVQGLEPSPDAKNQAIKNYNLKIQSPDELKNLPSESFDVVTMWHVLEHVHQLKPTLAELKRVLKKNGYLFIAVPNRNAWEEKVYKKNWAAYDVPRHLYHFNSPQILALVEEQGMNLVKYKGMPFDSFYISLLSEQYRGTGIFKYPLAVLFGKLTFLFSLFNKDKSSSLLYIIQKS